ncbi:hypothetical protein EAI30_06900 [Romboutsia ilealis]|uniref:Uncharacterized protein n=1 Tax=Romboutsia faecis TaxID=2764597 RepID=A0ABR7JKG4_9FIRM|nr:hypothetical protein [Romboutsia faecis]MBC5995418.1 hypothetical protein [Romboutsia faecis]MRN24340.1 hypothetical protein [Romboutsia ilealis]
MKNDMLDKIGIREDIINFINIIKNFDNQYNNIKHEEVDYMEYEAIDYEGGFLENIDLKEEYEISELNGNNYTKEIPDTWLEEIEFFSEKLNIISTENLILISKIINLGKDLMKNEDEDDKVIFIKNKYLTRSLIEMQGFYEDRDEIIEDLFSKKGEKLIKWVELGVKKLEF